MADIGDFSRDKKRKPRVFRKPDRELETFMPDSMRTPMVQVLGKSSVNQKSSSGSHFDVSYAGWEKRGRGRHYGDYDKRGSYHSDWGDKRYYYGGGDWDKRNNYHSEWEKSGYNSSRDHHGLIDSGRPPGSKSESTSTPVVTPVILSRVKSSNETKTQSVASTTSTTPKKELEATTVTAPPPQQPSIQPPSTFKNAGLEAGVIPENVMKRPSKLIGESLSLCDDISSFLLDQTQFLVLAFIGTQGTGKSTLASMMANLNTDPMWSKSCTFRPEGRDQIMSGCHCTTGVDVYVTSDRIILLDLQPLLSPSVMDEAISQDQKFFHDYGSAENTMEVESLQLVTFALSVAHVVVVVQNYTLDPNVIRLLQTCEMMKPSSSSSSSSISGRSGSSRVTIGGEELQQSFPHIVFVHNRSLAHHFVPSTLKELQSVYHQTFTGSYLEKESHIGLCNGILIPPLSFSSCSSLLNLFVLPDINKQEQCPITFAESVQEMKRQLLGLKRVPLTHVTLTEKSWYQYACRMWENVRTSSMCLEYSRLLP